MTIQGQNFEMDAAGLADPVPTELDSLFFSFQLGPKFWGSINGMGGSDRGLGGRGEVGGGGRGRGEGFQPQPNSLHALGDKPFPLGGKETRPLSNTRC